MFSSKATLGLALLFSGALMPVAVPVWAQAPETQAPTRQTPTALEAQAPPAPTEQSSFAEIEAKAPAQTAQQQFAAWEEFLRQYPQAATPWVARVTLKLSDLKFRALGDAPGALKLLHGALEQLNFDKLPDDRIYLAMSAARMHLATNDPAAAEAVMKENWGDVGQLALMTANTAYPQRVVTLESAKQSAQAVALLQEIRYARPDLLNGSMDSVTPWLWDKIIEFHLANPQADKAGQSEALRWAKLRFMLCGFNEASLSRATTSLTLVWALTDATQMSAFLAAQEDATKPNPLLAVAVPDFEEGRAPFIPNVDTQITLLLCSNTVASQKKAMIEAFKLASAPASATAGTAEVCRVFKACDLNTRRANEYLASFKDGGGAGLRAQLVSEFLVERK